MAFQYRALAASQRAHINTLRAAIVALLAVIVLLWMGWQSAPRSLRVHIPPDLSQGAHLAPDHPAPVNVYAFARVVWQSLNRWDAKAGPADKIYSLSAYLTPQFREELIRRFDDRSRAGQLVGRERALMGLPGAPFTPELVSAEGEGTWNVELVFDLVESVGGEVVKERPIAYTLRVVRYDVDQAANPWGLALAGFAAPPRSPTDATLQGVDRAW